MTQIQRRIDDQADRDRREFIQSRGLVKMNRRCKIRMCQYGSCRSEFYVKEVGGGKKLYCDTHRYIPLMLTQRKYRKTHREIINKKNNDWWVRNGGAVKQHQYYLKRKAAKLEAITHG
mgnify:CR=1 FL=1